MIRLAPRPRPGTPRRRWPRALAATSLLVTVLVWVTGDSDAQTGGGTHVTGDGFTIDVSKTTDLVSGETIEINVRTPEGTVISPSISLQGSVRTCKAQDGYTQAQFNNDPGFEGTCINGHSPLQPIDNSLDDDFLFRFPDNGREQGRRAITVLRPGKGTGHWTLRDQDQSLTCDDTHACRLVFDLWLQTGSAAPRNVLVSSPELELHYRPDSGVVGCRGPAAGAIESGMPDRLQDVWLDWTRSICQANGGEAPTNAFFQGEDGALSTFANGSRDLAYSAVGYRPGFDTAVTRRRGMVPVPVALNAVVVAVGGGYPVEDGSWPTDLPRPATEFRLTNAELATLLGQFQGAFQALYGDAVVARNPQVLDSRFLTNPTIGAIIGLTGPQSTTLFASSFFDTLTPDQWTDRAGAARGVEVDLNKSVPAHNTGEVSLKAARPDLAAVVYKNRFEQGTYYVLTDMATATAFGLTPVTLQNAAGDWVTPTAATMAAAVPGMTEQTDGTLMPNPDNAAGYPLTFVEYAMAPAQELVTTECTPRAASQQLLADWLDYITTDGQPQLASRGLAPLTSSLAQDAAARRDDVGATPATCGPPTTQLPTQNPPTANPNGQNPPPASVTDPGGVFPGGSGSGDGDDELAGRSNTDDNGTDDLVGGGSNRPARPTTDASRRQAARAAQEAEIELPDLLGVRSINALLPPLALIVIVLMTTLLALSTAGYPTPRSLVRLPGQVRRGAGTAIAAPRARLRRRSTPGAAA